MLPPSKAKILDILSDDPANRKLQMELAITIDAGESFVKSTMCLKVMEHLLLEHLKK